MHGRHRRGTGTGWISGPRNEDFTIDVAAAAAAIAEHRPDVVFISLARTTPPAPRCRRDRRALYEAAQAAGRRWSSSTRRTASSATGPRCCPLIEGRPTGASPAPCPRRSAPPGCGSAISPPTPPSSTPCSWCGCRTTCRPSPRPPRSPPWSTPTRCSGTSSSSRPSGTAWSPSCAPLGFEVTDSDANFVQFGRFADSHARLAGDPRPRRPGPGQRRTGLAAGLRGHPGRERRVPRRVAQCKKERHA